MASSRSSAAAGRFPRERRLRRRLDFIRIQSEGRRGQTRHFVLLVALQPVGAASPLPARLGLVVTRKVGHAVARNRIKRVCRACFRLWTDFLPDGVDLVVIARAGADTLGLDEVTRQWRSARPTLIRHAEALLALRGALP